MLRAFAILVVLAACGRVNFDPLSGSAPRACPASVNLVACYAFDGSLLDGSQYLNHATSTAISYEPGQHGQAVTIDASTIIAVTDSASLDLTQAITVEAWVDPTSLSTNRSVIVDHQDGYAVFLRDGVLAANLALAAGANRGFEAAVTIGIDSGWEHVAFTYDGATVTLWHNGSSVFAETYPGSLSTSSVEDMRIGGDSPSGDPMIGALDELRIWREVRTADQLCEAAERC